MEPNQVVSVIRGGESQEVEFKQSFHSAHEIAKAICAFANTLGGMLLIGVSDKKEIIGIREDPDSLQQQISAANQSVSPAPLVSVETHKIGGNIVVAVIVQKAQDNSYHTFQGAIYVRIGSTNRRMDGQTHLEFLRNRQILSFDESYEPEVCIEDIDLEKIKVYLKERKQENYLEDHSLQDFLLSAKLASANGKLRIKNSAVLLFAKDPVHYFPQMEIKLVQFSGIEAVTIVSHKLVQESLPGAINQAIAFFEKSLSKSIAITGFPKRTEEYEYPSSVIREAIVNAIAHRDYFSRDSVQAYIFDDRIEITNPGSIPNALPREMFGTISVQRNPITYRFLRDLGYVEGLGTGIPRMKNTMRKAGLPDPKFTLTENFFRITLYNNKGRKKPIESVGDLSNRQKKALDYVVKHKTIKAKTYAQLNKVSYATAVSDINEMISFGYLKKIGEYRGAYYVPVEKE